MFEFVKKLYFNFFERRRKILKDKQDKNEKKIYLTFDDGPIPEITEFVLEQLKLFKAKATFFCIGDNVKKHPTIYHNIIEKGHAIGNHTQHHVNAWKVSNETYISEAKLCEETLLKNVTSLKNTSPKLFRPPYGKITPHLSKELRKLEYTIVMWDVLAGDFDQSLAPESWNVAVGKRQSFTQVYMYLTSRSLLLQIENPSPFKFMQKKHKRNFAFCLNQIEKKGL